MAFASFAIDAGLGFDDRRGTQNAADLAALAAAWQSCNPEPGAGTPRQVARATAQANGYTHTPSGHPQVNVSGGGSTWTVEIVERNDTIFGGATDYAPDQLTVRSSATARCQDVGLLGGYAVFGQSSACTGNDVSLSGANTTINGGVHTNDDLHIPNSSAVVNGDATYRDNAVLGAGVTGTQYFGSSLPYPLSLSISEYAPGGSRAAAAGSNYRPFSGNVTRTDIAAVPGNSLSGSTLTIGAPGIYYTTGNITVNRTITLTGAAAAQGVTFVAGGEIDLAGVDNAKGYDPLVPGGTFPVFLFANGGGSPACNAKDIKIATNSATWQGLMYSPNGTTEISGSSVGSLNGSVIAYNVNVSSSDFTITHQPDPAAEPNYRVELLD
jgi:hypothetical protein